MAFELALPSKGTILPFPMHATYASKHTTKFTCIIEGQQPSSVGFIWLSQVLWCKHLNHTFAKNVH
jgi:hypothetical protein